VNYRVNLSSGIRLPLEVCKGAPRGARTFLCLRNEALTQKFNNHRYISNYCSHDYSPGVLDKQNITQRTHHQKRLRTTGVVVQRNLMLRKIFFFTCLHLGGKCDMESITFC